LVPPGYHLDEDPAPAVDTGVLAEVGDAEPGILSGAAIVALEHVVAIARRMTLVDGLVVVAAATAGPGPLLGLLVEGRPESVAEPGAGPIVGDLAGGVRGEGVLVEVGGIIISIVMDTVAEEGFIGGHIGVDRGPLVVCGHAAAGGPPQGVDLRNGTVGELDPGVAGIAPLDDVNIHDHVGDYAVGTVRRIGGDIIGRSNEEVGGGGDGVAGGE